MALFSVVTNFQSTLAQGMTASQSSMVLSNVTVQGHTLAPADYGSMLYITINPGAANMEVVRASTNSGTTFTLDKRGLLWYGDNDTESSTYKFQHNAGEPVIISNVKNIYDKFVDIFSDETVGGVKTFTSSPLVPTPLSSELDAAASVEFVNNTAFAGAPDATTTVKGIVELGTQAEVNTGDDSGSTTASTVVIPSTHLQTWDMIVTTDYTYGDTIVAGDALYLDTATAKWELADASLEATADGVIGIALDAGVDTDTGKRVQVGGVVTGLVGLTAGWVFLSDTAGDLSATAGTYKRIVGYAPNTTTMILVQPISADELTGGNSVLTVANLNEAATFFSISTMTGAESNTLKGGPTSNADSLHTHTILPSFFPATDWLQGTGTPTNPLFQVTSDPTGAYLYSVRLSGSSPNLLADIKRYDRDAITGNYYYNGVFASLTESGGDIGSGTTWVGICAGDTYVYVSVENSANSNIAIYRFAKDLSGETAMTISGTASTDNGKLAGNDTVLYVSEEGTSTNVKPYTISGTTATRGVDFTIAVQSQYRRGWWFDGTDLLFADANDSLKVKRYNVSGTLQATSSAQVYTETGFFEAGTPVGIGFFKTGAIYLIALRKQTDGTTIETYTIEGVGITKP